MVEVYKAIICTEAHSNKVLPAALAAERAAVSTSEGHYVFTATFTFTVKTYCSYFKQNPFLEESCCRYLLFDSTQTTEMLCFSSLEFRGRVQIKKIWIIEHKHLSAS